MEIEKKEPISPWITKDLLKSINKKNKLYKQYLNSPSKEQLQKFKTFKNKLKMLRGETVYVNFLVTVSCSLNISVVYFCN